MELKLTIKASIYLHNILIYIQQDAVDTVVCAPDDKWRYYPKHVEEFPV